MISKVPLGAVDIMCHWEGGAYSCVTRRVVHVIPKAPVLGDVGGSGHWEALQCASFGVWISCATGRLVHVISKVLVLGAVDTVHIISKVLVLGAVYIMCHWVGGAYDIQGASFGGCGYHVSLEGWSYDIQGAGFGDVNTGRWYM